MKGEVDSVQIATTDVILASQLSIIINECIRSEWNAAGLALTHLPPAEFLWKPRAQLGIFDSTIQPNRFYFKLEKYRARGFEEHVQEIVCEKCSGWKLPKLEGHG